MKWRVFHKEVTDSTNRDARGGKPGDVFTADFQTAGRGRLDHVWKSSAGENLMMSAVVGVDGLDPALVATLPLVVGISVCEALGRFLHPDSLRPPESGLKWPNDVLVGGRKVAGILCELCGCSVIAGIGVNVRQTEFPGDIAERATSLASLLGPSRAPAPVEVRDAVLGRLAENCAEWRERGFAAHLPRIEEFDCLKGRDVTVLRTDADASPASGPCGGIAADGSLLVAGERIYAGEAHVACPCSIHGRRGADVRIAP